MAIISSTNPVYHFMQHVKKTIVGNQIQKQTNAHTNIDGTC